MSSRSRDVRDEGGKRMARDSASDELVRQYEVLVCAGELVFSGTFKCNVSQRLIDALNEGVRESQLSTMIDFLFLENASMITAGGEKRRFPRIYIAKNNIAFVAEMSADAPGKKFNSYPYRRKLPVGVTIYSAQIHAAEVIASSYVLKGQLFIETWGQVADTIETRDRFLPLTQVEIDPPLPDGGAQFSFVAINRMRIISICEESEEAA
jgi:hypothetical protein